MPLPGSLAQKVHRQAAAAVGRVLAADASKQNGASIKRLALAPSNVAKRATFALICETLKYLGVIKEVWNSSDILKRNKKVKPELAYVLLYDLLFGEGLSPHGDAERVIFACKSTLKATLARLMVKRQVADVRDLLPETAKQTAPTLRHLRVNTLKISVDEALTQLRSHPSTCEVKRDDLLPEVLVLPSGTDVHNHPMVKKGSLILQGKASCLPARSLQPDPSWTVLDACAAPGNKTTHLAAMMNGKGCVMACDADARRLKRLKEAVELAGAKNVRVIHQDFLKIDRTDPSFKKGFPVLSS
ncbi:hypothetical protein CBR_g41718 [Chara braunii]|uniref:SAM-dependent MTase RsmB/NOP-type domain-containing protein n=1 Tax=Chara braunii TaxID=69332 RepID=A0A388LWH9_CHABU|nr:hypothetical protein CBR_g41718 [Chara braunii]|eukprot:GBG86656.1 hypothetical protein CBR_g41718 [Chara braunii]